MGPGDVHGADPSCPRCGYDQSGTMGTWTDRCPVYGQCPECGTRFEWAALHDPARADIPWMVEHANGWRGLVRRTPGMMGRLGWPRRFWRPVGVHARVDLWRLACWCLATLLVAHLMTGTGLLVAEWVFLYRLYPANAGVPDEILARIMVGSFLGPLFAVRAPAGASSVWQGLATLRLSLGGVPMLVMAILAFNLLWIVNLTAMPVTRRAAKLRVAHVGRAAIIGVWAAWLAMETERVAGVFWMLFPRGTVSIVTRWVLFALQGGAVSVGGRLVVVSGSVWVEPAAGAVDERPHHDRGRAGGRNGDSLVRYPFCALVAGATWPVVHVVAPPA